MAKTLLTFGEALRLLRDQAGLTQLQLATAVGTSSQNLSLIEQDARGVERDPELVERFEKALKVKPGQLARWLPEDHLARKIGVLLPFIGGISAGGFEPLLAAEPGEQVNVRDHIPRNCKIAVVTGKSCHRFGIFDGDLIVVRDATKPEDGQFVVAETGEGLTLKGYRDGHLYRWYPDTDEPEIVPYTEDTKLLGVVVQRLGDVRFDLPATMAAKKKGKKK